MGRRAPLRSLGARMALAFAIGGILFGLQESLLSAPNATEHGLSSQLGLVKALLSLLRECSVVLVWVILFHREIRFLGKYLGKAMSGWRALSLAACAAVGLHVVRKFLFMGSWLLFYCDITGSSVMPITKSSGTNLLSLVSITALHLKACLVSPIIEEITFRVAIFLLLLRKIGKWPAVILSSLLFGAMHIFGACPVPGFNWFYALNAALVGIVACVVLLVTHRVRWCIVLHSFFNVLVAIGWGQVGRTFF